MASVSVALHDDSTIMATVFNGQPGTVYWNHWHRARESFISDLSTTVASTAEPYHLYLCGLYVRLSGNLVISGSKQQQFWIPTHLTNRDRVCDPGLSPLIDCIKCALAGFGPLYYRDCIRTDQHLGNAGLNHHHSRQS